MHPQGVEDVKAVEINGDTIDVNKEMGIEEEKVDDGNDPKPA
jgi:hypothetical protein